MKANKYAVMFIVITIVTVLYHLLVGMIKTDIILQSSVQIYHALEYIALAGAAFSVVTGFLAIGVIVKKASTTAKEKSAAQASIRELEADPIKRLVHEILTYIREGGTTTYFEENLGVIAKQLPSLKKQIESVDVVIKHRFGENTISYNKFINPIYNLYSHLTKQISELLQGMSMFDEAKCEERIKLLEKQGNNTLELKEYKEVMQHYTSVVQEILISIEKTSVRLDKLVLEISKLSDEELQQSISMLEELDRVIVNTKLYK